LLLQQQLITPALYFALMLMGLIATLLPALIGLHRAPLDIKSHLPRSSRANR